MAGFELLRQVVIENARAAEEEARQIEAEVESDPRRVGVREGVPVKLWRAAGLP